MEIQNERLRVLIKDQVTVMRNYYKDLCHYFYIVKGYKTPLVATKFMSVELFELYHVTINFNEALRRLYNLLEVSSNQTVQIADEELEKLLTQKKNSFTYYTYSKISGKEAHVYNLDGGV